MGGKARGVLSDFRMARVSSGSVHCEGMGKGCTCSGFGVTATIGNVCYAGDLLTTPCAVSIPVTCARGEAAWSEESKLVDERGPHD